METEVVAVARRAFGPALGDAAVAPGARGAMGQVWRVRTGGGEFALKHVFRGTPPGPVEVEAEVAFLERALEAGVRLPASHPDVDGRHLVPLPDGGWLRLYDWVDLRPADLPAQTGALGVLLARLHSVGTPADRELSGDLPDAWYDVPPDPASWASLVRAASAAGTTWAAPLAAAVDSVPGVYALTAPAEPADLRLCHRDLHPGNVLADGSGDLVVIDWDDLGPLSPARELARALVTCFHDGVPDLVAVRRTHEAYVAAGGPARLTSPADFTMLIVTQLNFLQGQVRVALDPAALPRDHDWAELEIEESLRTLPTPALVTEILDALA